MFKSAIMTSFVLVLSTTNAQSSPTEVKLTAGQEMTVALPHIVTRTCKVKQPKTCTEPVSDLVNLSVQEENFDVAKSAAKSSLAHCIDSRSGKFQRQVFVAKLEAKENSSGAAYGHDQVTVLCTMQDGTKKKSYLEISVFPKEDK